MENNYLFKYKTFIRNFTIYRLFNLNHKQLYHLLQPYKVPYYLYNACFLFRTSKLFNALDNLCGLGSLVFMGSSRGGLPMNWMVSTSR